MLACWKSEMSAIAMFLALSAGAAPGAEPPYYGHFFNTIHQETRNTAIADMFEFQYANMLANTAITDVADISDIWATMGRHMSARAAPEAEPPYY